MLFQPFTQKPFAPRSFHSHLLPPSSVSAFRAAQWRTGHPSCSVLLDSALPDGSPSVLGNGRICVFDTHAERWLSLASLEAHHGLCEAPPSSNHKVRIHKNRPPAIRPGPRNHGASSRRPCPATQHLTAMAEESHWRTLTRERGGQWPLGSPAAATRSAVLCWGRQTGNRATPTCFSCFLRPAAERPWLLMGGRRCSCQRPEPSR